MMDESHQRFSRNVEWLFYVLAVVGLVGTQLQIARMPMEGFVDGTIKFWIDVASRPASLFLTVDVLVLSTVVFAWMFSEARRLGMRFVWIYYLGALFVAVSFFVPLFMGVRQRRLRAAADGGDAPLATSDWIAVGIAMACSLVAVAFSMQTVFAGA
jgi:hypothetical protein